MPQTPDSRPEERTPPPNGGALEPGKNQAWCSPLAWLILITAAGAALRLFRLDRESIYYDESLSYWYTTQAYSYLWSVYPTFDVHPPLFMLMLKAWVSVFGDTETGLRSFSTVAGVAALPMTYLAGRLATGNPWTGLLAAAFIALSPTHLFFAQEARPYTWLTLGAATAMAGAFWILANPARAALPWMGLGRGERGRDMGAMAAWGALCLGAAFSLWMHNLGMILPVSLALSVLPAALWRLRGSIPLAVNAALAGLVIAGLWAPNLPDLLAQTQRVHANFWQKDLTMMMFLQGIDYLLFSLFPSWFFALLFIALALDGAVALKSERGWPAVSGLVGMFIAPLAVTLAVNALFRPVFAPRIILWVTIPFFILAAHGFCRVVGRSIWTWAPVSVLTLACFALADHWYYTRPPIKDPWRDIAAHIASGSGPKDTVLAVPNSAAIPIYFYTRRSKPDLKIVPLPAPFPAVGMDREYPFSAADPSIKPGDERFLRDLDCKTASIWYVDCGGGEFDPGNIILNHLSGRCGLLGRARTRAIRVYQFGSRASGS